MPQRPTSPSSPRGGDTPAASSRASATRSSSGGAAAEQQPVQHQRAPWWPTDAPRTLVSLHMAAVCVMTSAQLLITASLWRQTDDVGRFLTALQTAVKLAVATAVLWRPSAYWKRRAWAAPGARIIFYLLPTVRSVGMGTSLLLERVAQPGWRGAAADVARVLAGTRLIALVVGGCALPMPPAVTLLTQTALLLLVRNGAAYCSCPLLEHPLTRHRAALLAKALEVMTQPFLLLQPIPGFRTAPMASALRNGLAPPAAVCRATLALSEAILVVVGPLLLSVYCWDPPPLQPPAEAGAAPQGPPANSSPAAAAKALCYAALDWVARCIEAAVAAANRALRHALRSPAAGFDSRAVVGWWLLSVSWWVCKRSQGL